MIVRCNSVSDIIKLRLILDWPAHKADEHYRKQGVNANFYEIADSDYHKIKGIGKIGKASDQNKANYETLYVAGSEFKRENIHAYIELCKNYNEAKATFSMANGAMTLVILSNSLIRMKDKVPGFMRSEEFINAQRIATLPDEQKESK